MKKPLSLLSLALGLFAMSFITGVHDGYHVGDVARDFKLMNVDKSMKSMADAKDAKGYIIIFTCNHCPFAKAYEDRIIQLHEKYAPQGYPVIAINPNDKDTAPDDSFEKMQERAESKKFPFWYLYDDKQEIAKAYGATRTPHVYLLDEKRVVRYIGAIDDNSEDADMVEEKYLENAIDALHEGKDVEVSFTKAIGCTIKWKS